MSRDKWILLAVVAAGAFLLWPKKAQAAQQPAQPKADVQGGEVSGVTYKGKYEDLNPIYKVGGLGSDYYAGPFVAGIVATDPKVLGGMTLYG